MKSDFVIDCCTGFLLRYLPYPCMYLQLICTKIQILSWSISACKKMWRHLSFLNVNWYWLSIYNENFCLFFNLYWLSILLIVLYHYLDKSTSKFLGHRSVTVIEWKTLMNLVKYLTIQNRLQKLVSLFFLYSVHLAETKKKWKRQEVGAR